MTLAILISLALWALAISLTIWGTWLARRHFRSSPPHLDAPFGLYPVSILKPCKGVEAGSSENLEGFFRLEYPEYELVFSVADANDPVCPLLRRLIAAHRRVDAKLIIGNTPIGPNPKINNLVKGYESAKHDLILISDSNVRVGPEYLKRLVAHLSTDVGMVTAIVAGRDPHGAGGHLESVFLNSFYARGMFMAWAVGKPTVIGKSMLFRRSVASRFGGIRNLGRYLAEDFVAGEAFRHLGLKVVLTVDPVVQHIGRHTFGAFWSRHLRWGRIRKSQAPIIFGLEPLFSAIGSAFIGAFAFSRGFEVSPSLFVALHLCVWSACDFYLLRHLTGGVATRVPFYWFVRELLAFPLWLHISSGNTVNWRGQILKLQPGGTLESTPRAVQ